MLQDRDQGIQAECRSLTLQYDCRPICFTVAAPGLLAPGYGSQKLFVRSNVLGVKELQSGLFLQTLMS